MIFSDEIRKYWISIASLLFFVAIGLVVLSTDLQAANQVQGWMTQELRKSLTEPFGGFTEERLLQDLNNQSLGPLSVTNFLKHTLRSAIAQGVPATTILMIFFLPLVGVTADVFHYLIGLKGYGIFVPAMVMVAFWVTGIVGGLILFGVILFLTLLARKLFYKIKLHYWPRRSLTLWVVSLGTFLLTALGPRFSLLHLKQVSIFPLLLLILLAEEHTRIQRRKSQRVAIKRTLVTLVLASLATLVISWPPFQKLILLHPELSLLATLVISLGVGRYTGFRLLEYRRFQAALRDEEE
jgi:hypothetical protein